MPRAPPSPSTAVAERADQEALAARLGVFALELTIESGRDLSPAFRRVRLTGPGLATLPALPGHDLMVSVDPERPSLRRRYTIRELDAGAEVPADEVAPDIQLLTEIRDLLAQHPAPPADS